MDKILSLFGLIRMSSVRDISIEPFTDEEIDSMYVQVAHKRAEGFNKDKYEEMVDLLRKNQAFADFLDWTIDNDIVRSFNVTEAERQIVRGAVTRTRYLRGLCFQKSDDALEKFNSKIKRK